MLSLIACVENFAWQRPRYMWFRCLSSSTPPSFCKIYFHAYHSRDDKGDHRFPTTSVVYYPGWKSSQGSKCQYFIAVKRIAQDQLKYREKHKSTQFLHTIFINWSGKSFKALDLGEYDIKSLNQLASAWLKNTPPSALHPPTHQALYHQPRPFRAKI